MNLYEIHERMTKHLFPAYSSEDERFLSLALCGEAAEFGEMVLDFNGEDLDDVRDEVADCRVYLELLAKCFAIEGDKLVVIRESCIPSIDVISTRLMVEAGLLANKIKKRWRDGVDISDQCRELIVRMRATIELAARYLGIEGDALDRVVVAKLERVVEKHRARLATPAAGNTLEDSEYGN